MILFYFIIHEVVKSILNFLYNNFPCRFVVIHFSISLNLTFIRSKQTEMHASGDQTPPKTRMAAFKAQYSMFFSKTFQGRVTR